MTRNILVLAVALSFVFAPACKAPDAKKRRIDTVNAAAAPSLGDVELGGPEKPAEKPAEKTTEPPIEKSLSDYDELAAKFRLQSTGQVTEVHVRGYDEGNTKEVVGKSIK